MAKIKGNALLLGFNQRLGLQPALLSTHLPGQR